MKKGIDIHDYPRRLALAVRRVEKANISEKNKKAILEFREFCSLTGLSLSRTERYMQILKSWALIFKEDFDKATKEQVMDYVRVIQENERYSPWTKATYKSMLKRFYKWLKNTEDEFPAEVKWMKTVVKLSDRKLPANGDLLTEEEVKKLINLADHPRDKALISTLYESGARIGELATLQIGNVKVDEYGAILNVEGKTGARPIRIVSSFPYLATWMQNHPLKDDANAPLWINVGTKRHNLLMQYPNILYMLKMLFKKAGIQKRFNPHMFRHSRATFLADHLTEFQMNQYLGWVQGSGMPATYIHMSGKKIDGSILDLNGVKKEENHKESTMNPSICQKCDMINVHDAKFCTKCGGIMDIKAALEVDKEMKEKDKSHDLMSLLMQDKKFVEVLMSKAKELGLGG